MKPYAARAAERRQLLQAALDALIRRAQALPDIRAIYVFGSYAANRIGPRSDLDVLIVRETKASRWHRDAGLEVGLDVPAAIDALILTPQEFDELPKRSTFGASIVATMHSVYAA